MEPEQAATGPCYQDQVPTAGGSRSGHRIHEWTDAITGVCGDATAATASSERCGATSALTPYSAATQLANGR